jgi:hypothetical protein
MSFSPFSLLASPAVLSDDKRRALYDAGMYDPLDDDDDQEDVEVKAARRFTCRPVCLPISNDIYADVIYVCCDGFRDSTTSCRRWSRSWPER